MPKSCKVLAVTIKNMEWLCKRATLTKRAKDSYEAPKGPLKRPYGDQVWICPSGKVPGKGGGTNSKFLETPATITYFQGGYYL